MLRHFYATADDLLPVFERVEKKHKLAYHRTGLFSSPDLSPVFSGAEIPTLHTSLQVSSAINGPNYLVTPAHAVVHVHEAPQNRGGVLYPVDQLINPDSITILHGGFYRPQILLYGRIGTVWETDFAKQVYRAFASAIKKHFIRINAFFVGPQAKALLDQGCRLTGGADSPTLCDLRELKK